MKLTTDPHARITAALTLALLVLVAGCQTPAPSTANLPPDSSSGSALTLREGDTVKIAFPANPNLNTVQQIRRDGQISLALVGELKAAGLTPLELGRQVAKLYEPQLLSKEVTVAVESAAYPVFVTGAVLKPGKIVADRPLTALEAIMEAGGFDFAKAKLNEVTVIRHEEGQVRNYQLDMKSALAGRQAQPFYVKPSDIIYVREKFAIF